MKQSSNTEYSRRKIALDVNIISFLSLSLIYDLMRILKFNKTLKLTLHYKCYLNLV